MNTMSLFSWLFATYWNNTNTSLFLLLFNSLWPLPYQEIHMWVNPQWLLHSLHSFHSLFSNIFHKQFKLSIVCPQHPFLPHPSLFYSADRSYPPLDGTTPRSSFSSVPHRESAFLPSFLDSATPSKSLRVATRHALWSISHEWNCSQDPRQR